MGQNERSPLKMRQQNAIIILFRAKWIMRSSRGPPSVGALIPPEKEEQLEITRPNQRHLLTGAPNSRGVLFGSRQWTSVQLASKTLARNMGDKASGFVSISTSAATTTTQQPPPLLTDSEEQQQQLATGCGKYATWATTILLLKQFNNFQERSRNFPFLKCNKY